MVVGGGAADPEPSRPLQWGGEAALWGLIRRADVCRPDVGVCCNLSISRGVGAGGLFDCK